jgi:hypothetical protein
MAKAVCFGFLPSAFFRASVLRPSDFDSGLHFEQNADAVALSKFAVRTTKYSGGFLEFIHSWRYFLWVLAFCLAVGVLYLEEDWRGHWSWQRYKRQMSSRGEQLEASAFIPPRVPDDKNFAMTPFLAPLFDFVPGSQQWTGSNPVQGISGFAPKYDAASRELAKINTVRSNSWIKAPTDLSTWYIAFLKVNTNNPARQPLLRTNFSRQEAAKGVLAELSECDRVLEEVQAASQLPYSRFNLRYEEDNPAGILLPHLAILKHLCQVLELRASARLALGQTEAAFNDVKLMLFLSEALRDEPILISQLVRMAQIYLTLQPLAEGLGQWSEPQLRELQQKLAHLDFCADAKRNLAAERAWGGAIIDYVRRSSEKYNLLGNVMGQPQPDFAGVLIGAAPDGWLDLEKLHYSRVFQEYLLPMIDLGSRRISPAVTDNQTKRIAALSSNSWPVAYVRHRFFSKLLLPAMDKFVRKTAFGQTAVDTAMLACALERYRQVHGRYPESLDALTPEFVAALPHDIITGQPLKYRLSGTERYVLYSVGWNEMDDEGTVSPTKSGEDIAAEEGDWVWRLP